MPKTKFQDLIFCIIMVFTMVYSMTIYNMVLEFGFTYDTFLKAFLGMWPEAAGAFVAQRYIAGPRVQKKVMSWFKPGVDKSVFITVAMAGLTVSMMCPIMTLYVTILHHGLSRDILLFWLPKLVQNFPFALCIQLFYIGPLVRLVFRTIFKKQLAMATPRVAAEV